MALKDKTDFNKIFQAAPSFLVRVPHWELGHFDTKVIQWKAVQTGLCQSKQWIAYRMTGFEYDQAGTLYLFYACKAFNEDAGIIPGDQDSEPLRSYLPLNWNSCDEYAC